MRTCLSKKGEHRTLPNSREHRKLCVEKFGEKLTKQFNWVNYIMDHPWQELFGKDHRKVAHNEAFARMMEQQYGYWAGQFVRFHIECDRRETNRKNKKAREKYKLKKALNKKRGKNKI